MESTFVSESNSSEFHIPLDDVFGDILSDNIRSSKPAQPNSGIPIWASIAIAFLILQLISIACVLIHYKKRKKFRENDPNLGEEEMLLQDLEKDKETLNPEPCSEETLNPEDDKETLNPEPCNEETLNPEDDKESLNPEPRNGETPIKEPDQEKQNYNTKQKKNEEVKVTVYTISETPKKAKKPIINPSPVELISSKHESAETKYVAFHQYNYPENKKPLFQIYRISESEEEIGTKSQPLLHSEFNREFDSVLSTDTETSQTSEFSPSESSLKETQPSEIDIRQKLESNWNISELKTPQDYYASKKGVNNDFDNETDYETSSESDFQTPPQSKLLFPSPTTFTPPCYRHTTLCLSGPLKTCHYCGKIHCSKAYDEDSSEDTE